MSCRRTEELFASPSFRLSHLGRAATLIVGVLRLGLLILSITFLSPEASAADSAAAFTRDRTLTLTLGEAQQLAVARSRQLAGQDLVISSARDMAVVADQLPDPVLKLGIDNAPLNGPDRGSLTRDFMTMRRVGVMQEITRSEKRQARAAVYERAADKSVAEKSELVTALRRDTALAWLDRWYAERMLAVVVEQAVQAKTEVDAAEGSYRAGRGSQAEIFAARGAVAMVADRASELQRQLRNAKTMLARWIGDAGAMPLAEPAPINTLRLDRSTLEAAFARHPKIAILSRQAEIADAETRLAQANKKPDWTVEVAYQQRGPMYSNMVSVGVSVPVQWGQKNRQNRELSAKLAMAEQARAERDEMLRSLVAETRVMMNEWETGRERVTRFEQELIPLAASRTAASTAAYRGGKSTLADVLQARRDEIDLRLQSLRHQADVARLWAQLNFLLPDDSASAAPSSVMQRDLKVNSNEQ